MATLTPSPKMQFFDANGNPLVGGKLYTYQAGTVTPLATYTDSTGGTPNTNPIILDSRGEASVWLGTSPYYMELKTSTDVLVWTADDIESMVSFLQSGAGAVATTVQSRLRETVSVKDFGAVGNGIANDTAAIQAAITSVTASGGTVYFPKGTYSITGITVPAHVYLTGDGERATVITYAGSGIAITVGGTAGTLYYHSGVMKLSILLSNTTATAISAIGTCGGKFHDMYIEGPINATRSTRGIVLDGGNASSFFNDVRNVIVNHMHTAYELISTGSLQSTQQLFTNCNSIGDVATDTTSVCLLVNTNQGNGTSWVGGNAESCGRGFYFAAGAGSICVFGGRLEGNTYDVYLNAGVNAQSFFGLINLAQAKIFDASGTGLDKHTFVGCIDANTADQNAPFNVWPGTNKFKAMAAASTPITLIGYSGQAVDVMVNKTSAGIRTSGIGADMNYFGDSFLFPAGQVASGNANALDDYEEGVWTPVIGGSGGETGQSYTFQRGKYTKIGNLVAVTCDVLLANKGTITGDVQIKGLPFANTSTGPFSAAALGYVLLTTSTVSEIAYIAQSATAINFRIKTAAATSYTAAAAGDISNSTQIILAAIYQV